MLATIKHSSIACMMQVSSDNGTVYEVMYMSPGEIQARRPNDSFNDIECFARFIELPFIVKKICEERFNTLFNASLSERQEIIDSFKTLTLEF